MLEFNYSIVELNDNMLAFNFKQMFKNKVGLQQLLQSNVENSAKIRAYQQYMLTIAS